MDFHPHDLERRASDLYYCDCGAALDYPGAWCPSCDTDPQDHLVPLEDGPDAADLWEAAQAAQGPQVRLVPFGDVMVSPGASLEDRRALALALGGELPAPLEDHLVRRHPVLEALGRLLALLVGSGLVVLFLVALLVPDPILVPYVEAFKAAAGLAFGAFLGWALGRVTP